MPTNEERREVAEKFRKEADNGEPFVTASIVGLSDLSYGDWKAGRNDAECWNWLADLIEPEPERTVTPVLDKSSWYIWRCPECGQPINKADNYCSSCGVKVTPIPL